MNKINLLALYFATIAFISCAREWPDPNTSIPAKELNIARLLALSNSYDSSGVIVKGMIWDLDYVYVNKDETEIPLTTFKIADQNGNYIGVIAKGYYPVFDGEIIKVTGIYRRKYLTKNHTYINEIEAVELRYDDSSIIHSILHDQ